MWQYWYTKDKGERKRAKMTFIKTMTPKHKAVKTGVGFCILVLTSWKHVLLTDFYVIKNIYRII